MLDKGTGLALQQDARLQTLQTVPDVLWNIHASSANPFIKLSSIIIISIHFIL
jgi:hypothetical protein